MTDIVAGVPTFDVSAFLDRQKIGPTQLLVLGLCAVAMAMDGYDVFVVGYVLPAIARDFGVPPPSLTMIFVVQQIGLAIGSIFVGPVADRLGRRNVLVISTALYGAITLATTQAISVTELAALRFAAWIFFSGVIPNAIALTTEIAPTRSRATFVTIMFCGYTGGSALGGLLATLLVTEFGWRGAFWGGGLIPLLLLPVFWFALPESLRFRVQRNAQDPRIARFLKRLDPRVILAGSERFILNEERVSGAPVVALFRDGRAAATALLWVCFFMNLFAITLVAAWTPTYFTKFGGMTLPHAALLGSIVAGAGIVTMLFYGRLLDSFGVARILWITFLLGGIGTAAIGFVGWNGGLFYVALLLEGACVIGGQSGLNALSAILYPTRMRATGVSWAFGAGRLGSIFGPVAGGFMLARGWTAGPIFLAVAVPIFIVALGAFLVGFGDPAVDEPSAAKSV
jgi:MFS transporter, AAHS family, 4-hydroxybenzoate transporter